MPDPNEPKQPKNRKAARQEEMIRKSLIAAGKIAPHPDDAQEQAKRKKQSKGYKKGGKVRGCGCAQRGLTKGTMR